METPFPGMDPYLEHPTLWPGVHARLMIALANRLRPLIRPRYVASVEERLVIEEQQEHRIPDVAVKRARDDGGGPAVAEPVADAPLVLEAASAERRERYIDIHDRYQNMKVVTTIEVVSPSNKAPGPARRAYRRKQRDTLRSECHLVEIDLLRRGRHVLCVPQSMTRAAPPYDYLTCVSRWPQRERYEVYPRALRERLPCIRVPLTAPDADAPLDVQGALEQVYEEGDFMLVVLYDQPCVPRLSAADQRWANERWVTYKAAHKDLFPNPPAGNGQRGSAP
jgi:hypothetical protein